ncbi:MAG: hypothetical protein ACOCUI_05585 [bacterium]
MKEYEVEVSWTEKYTGTIKIKAENEMEADMQMRELDTGEAVEEILEGSSEQFMGVDYDSIRLKLQE